MEVAVDFLYDVFYEILSEEGVWVLILIASAFAVASFILLTLRMETSPKQSAMSQKGTKPQKVKQPKSEKKKRKGKEKDTITQVEDTSPESNADIPPNPEMAPPATFTHPEVILPGSAPYKNIPQPVGEECPTPAVEQAAESVTQPAPGLALDSLDVAPIPDDGATAQDGKQAPEPSADRVPISAAGQGAGRESDIISVGIADAPEGEGLIVPQKSGAGQESGTVEESEEGKKSGDDILDLFEEADEGNSGLVEFAKDLDDVALSSLLTETEDLSQELKDILTKHGRRI